MVQWYTNIVQSSTNGTIGNTIGTNGNANGTIGSPNGTIGVVGKPTVPLATNGTIEKLPLVPLGEPRMEPKLDECNHRIGPIVPDRTVWFRIGPKISAYPCFAIKRG